MSFTPIVKNAAYVVGPASATDNAIARFDGTTGKLVQNSGVTIDDSDNLSVAGTIFDNNDRPLYSTAARTITVGPSGDYSTIQAAVNQIPYYLNHAYRIEVADGTYTEDVILGPITGKRASVGTTEVIPLVVTGNTTTPASVKVNSFFVMGFNGDAMTLTGFEIQGENPYDNERSGIIAYGSREVAIGNITFAAGHNGITSYNSLVMLQAAVNFGSSVLTGEALRAKRHGWISFDPLTANISGTVAGYAYQAQTGRIDFHSNVSTLTGTTGLVDPSSNRFGKVYDSYTGTDYSVKDFFNDITMPLLTVTNTTDTASNNALILQSDRATPTNNDLVIQQFKLSDSAGNQDVFSQITSRALSVTSGAENGQLRFGVVKSGSYSDDFFLQNGILAPVSNDGVAIGAGTAAWSDLFLASGGVINWNNGNVTVTHSADNLAISKGVTLASTAGTAASGITFGTDANLYRSAADILKTDDSFIVATKLGVGASTATNKLHITQSANDASGGVGVFNVGEVASVRLWMDASDNGRLDGNSSGNQPVIINGSGTGKVGIGTTSPSAKLQVNGNIATTMQSTTLAAAATAIAVTSNVVKVTGDGGGNTIATITGGVSGQILTLIFVDALVTITDTAATTANTVNLSAAFTSAANTTLSLVYDGNKWFETARSVNG